MHITPLFGLRVSFALLFTISSGRGGLVVASETEPPADESGAWKLVWSDEFSIDGAPDPAKWAYDVGGHGWGNKELQFYTEDRRENARVANDHLIIEAHREPWQAMGFTSARLVTRARQAWQGGRFEIRARLPEGRGTWPAIWMLPVENIVGSGDWPDIGEIDIMEHVGSNPGTVHATAHSKDYSWMAGTQKTATVAVPAATREFHVYALEWTADELRAYVDGQLYFRYANEGEGWSKWPYDQPFYLILNVAVGGTWGGEKGVDESCFPQRMEIDYVRVYRR